LYQIVPVRIEDPKAFCSISLWPNESEMSGFSEWDETQPHVTERFEALHALHRLVSSVKVSSDKASVTVLKKRRSKNFCKALGGKKPIADSGLVIQQTAA